MDQSGQFTFLVLWWGHASAGLPATQNGVRFCQGLGTGAQKR